MDKGSTPLYKAPGIRDGDSWSFQTLEEVHETSGYADEIEHILKLANGRNSAQDIIAKLGEVGLDPATATAVIEDMFALGIVVDSRNQIESFHQTTNNPPYFPRTLTDSELAEYTREDPFTPRKGRAQKAKRLGSVVIGLGRERISTRAFSEEPVSLEELITCLDAAYAKEIRPIPSAGGLYPLRFYGIVSKPSTKLPQGYYQYDHTDSSLIQIEEKFDAQALQNIFNAEKTLLGAPSAIVVAADTSRHNGKYANRGYRFTLLEAGQAAQNILLTATELGLNTLEYGGFQDEKLAHELAMPNGEVPLITIAVGRLNKTNSQIPKDNLPNFETLIGPNMPVRSVRTEVSPEKTKELYEYISVGEYYPLGSELPDFTVGIGSTVEQSRLKATVEAYERYSSGNLKVDLSSPASSLGGNWLDPRNVRPMSKDQLEKKPYLKEFNAKETMEWVQGKRADGTDVWVPVDLVYYPLHLQRRLVSEADSSGVAAHFDVDEAKKRAFYELIERDAIMRLWATKQSPKQVNPEQLGVHICKMNLYWKSHSRTNEVFDLSVDGAGVALAISRSNDGSWPFFVSGAAAASSFEQAAAKAYQEMQGLLVGSLDSPQDQFINSTDVKSPRDHGLFYHNPINSKEIDWLWDDPQHQDMPKIYPRDLIDKYNPIIIELSKGETPLHVVRVICPELVPISFGFGNEYHLHPAIGLSQFTPTAPHFFA